jgi:hypothetical protein
LCVRWPSDHLYLGNKQLCTWSERGIQTILSIIELTLLMSSIIPSSFDQWESLFGVLIYQIQVSIVLGFWQGHLQCDYKICNSFSRANYFLRGIQQHVALLDCRIGRNLLCIGNLTHQFYNILFS